jgi:cytochrome c oxidase subunit 3
MATTVHEPPKIEPERLPSQGSGNGGWRNLVPADGDLRRVQSYSPPPASTGIWVIMASITMSFAAFTSALVVRQGTAPLQHISLPPVLYLNTLVIIASSVTLEIARRRAQGFGLAANISYSFFYVLTVMHALHLLGGLGGMARVVGKLRNATLRRSTLDATLRYWHFMGVLWVYLLLLLWMKL